MQSLLHNGAVQVNLTRFQHVSLTLSLQRTRGCACHVCYQDQSSAADG